MSIAKATGVPHALRVTVRGAVQGRGVRPAIARWARSLALTGVVRNTNQGIVIDVEGTQSSLHRFTEHLSETIPGGSSSSIDIEERIAVGGTDFRIEPSDHDGGLRTPVPPDRAVCRECLDDIRDDVQPRRRGYAFVSCAACGPRYSVISAMPYDRKQTSLVDFPLCQGCNAEFESAGDRRFHAETTTCSECGPRIWMVNAGGDSIGGNWQTVVRTALEEGKVVAIRGVGGYQLLCDATDPDAVARLRRRKGRATKPLAVLVEDIAAAKRVAWIDGVEQSFLTDGANPIVVVRARAGSSLASIGVHPGLNHVGVMLPTSAMHWLIARDFGRPLVCTSGNREGEPLEYEPLSAERNLAGIADLWLHHNRDIVHPIDDSVVRSIAGERVTYRLARGLAPLALPWDASSIAVLAVGGQQKSTLAWHNGAQAVLGPHIGDLDSIATLDRWQMLLREWRQLYQFDPQRFFCDAHPDYTSTRFAGSQSCDVTAVQHHHAHVASAMLQAGLMDREVLGAAWDGSGYGPDGTVWGGEFLRATLVGFERIARLRPFPLPGGEKAILDPARIAAALVLAAMPEDFDRMTWLFEANRIRQARLLRDRANFSPITSSVGRLFDAVAWVLLGDDVVGFDGRPAMMLECLADRRETGCYPMPLQRDVSPWEWDWRPLVRGVIADVRCGTSPGTIAMRCHRALARSVVHVAEHWNDLPVVLSGGVFQNQVLVELVVEEWDRAAWRSSRKLVVPGTIPPNDGGLAAGQLAIGLAMSDRGNSRIPGA